MLCLVGLWAFNPRGRPQDQRPAHAPPPLSLSLLETLSNPTLLLIPEEQPGGQNLQFPMLLSYALPQ